MMNGKWNSAAGLIDTAGSAVTLVIDVLYYYLPFAIYDLPICLN